MPQIAQRYAEQAKGKGKVQKKGIGKRKLSLLSSSLPAKRTCSQQPAASMPALLPAACVSVSVLDLDSLVHVPVSVGPEGEAEGLVTVEVMVPMH